MHVRTILRSRVGKCLAYSLLVMLYATVGTAQERIALHLTGGGVLTTPVTAITALGGVPTPKGLLFSGATATWQPWFVIGADAELTPGNRGIDSITRLQNKYRLQRTTEARTMLPSNTIFRFGLLRCL